MVNSTYKYQITVVDPVVPTSFPIDSGLGYIGLDPTGVLAPNVFKITTNLYVLDMTGAYTTTTLDALLLALLQGAGLTPSNGAGGSKSRNSGHSTEAAVAPTATAMTDTGA